MSHAFTVRRRNASARGASHLRTKASAPRCAGRSFTATAAEFGSNPGSNTVPPSSLLFSSDRIARETLAHGPILLVEDNSGDVLLVREMLKEHKIDNELLVVADGEKAIEFLTVIEAGDHPVCPALVILDLNLPRKSGREVLAYIRETSRCVSIPVLVLSSSNASADRQAALNFGARQYIRKPSDLAAFMDIGVTIRQLLAA